MQIENCTSDQRNLVTRLPSGARVILRLGPGEISKNLDDKVIEILRQNRAVDLLFKQNLLRVLRPGEQPRKVEASKKAEPSVAAFQQAEKAKKTATKRSKTTKNESDKLDLGV